MVITQTYRAAKHGRSVTANVLLPKNLYYILFINVKRELFNN